MPAVARQHAAGAPWLRALDGAGLAVLNLGLLAEVALVFVNTVARAAYHEVIPGLEETAQLLLVYIAFVGGGIAFGKGRFIAITAFVALLPGAGQRLAAAVVNWAVILLAAVIGGEAIPLQIANATERSTLLGIPSIWMTLPMMAGAAFFILHAARALLAMPRRPVLAAGAAVLLCATALWFARDGDWVDGAAFPALLAGSFAGLIAIGLPVGFVLAAVGILTVVESGSAPLVAVAMTAQRGAGGFIFLALPFFILAGFIMDKGGIGARIVGLLTSLLGHFRGGLLQISIVGMYVASGISGSKAADMAAVGIPMTESLRRQGYEGEEAAAVLAASAAMGESIPPSIAILALGSVTSLSTGALFLAGLLPAAVIAVLLMLVVAWRARHADWRPTARATMRERMRAGRAAILPLLMPVALIGGIVAGLGTPTEMSSFAVAYGLLLAAGLYRQVGPRAFWQLLTEANLLSGMIFLTFAGATLFSWALSLEGVPDALAATLTALGATLFLPAVIVVTILLGAVLESIVTVVILGPLLLPVAQHLGVDPLQFGIVLIESFGVGSIIPPVGLALYIACAIFRVEVHRTVRPVSRYLAVLCVGLLVVAAVPWITDVLPNAFNFTG